MDHRVRHLRQDFVNNSTLDGSVQAFPCLRSKSLASHRNVILFVLEADSGGSFMRPTYVPKMLVVEKVDACRSAGFGDPHASRLSFHHPHCALAGTGPEWSYCLGFECKLQPKYAPGSLDRDAWLEMRFGFFKVRMMSDPEPPIGLPASVLAELRVPEGTFVLTYGKLDSEDIVRSVVDDTGDAIAVFIGT